MQVCWQTPNLSDIKWRSTFEMGAARLRSYTKITPKWLFLYVSRSHTRYGFRADARAFRFSVNVIKNETVVPGRQSVIVRWGYYCKCTAYKSEFPCCRPFHLSSLLVTYEVFGYYPKPLYIYLFILHSMPVQVVVNSVFLLRLRACLYGGGGPQVGVVTRLVGITRPSI